MCVSLLSFFLFLSVLDLFFVQVSVCLIKGTLSHNCIGDNVFFNSYPKYLSHEMKTILKLV